MSDVFEASAKMHVHGHVKIIGRVTAGCSPVQEGLVVCDDIWMRHRCQQADLVGRVFSFSLKIVVARSRFKIQAKVQIQGMG